MGPEVWPYLDLWRSWRMLGDAALPEPGDLGEQPGYVYQAIEACEISRCASERRMQEEQERGMERARKQSGVKTDG
jgi:hypothetical protein